jgi:thioesterase domain-containing protein
MIDKAELEQRIRNGIPLSRHMAFRVLDLSSAAIRVSGGADENINVHGTAFAGSLYAVCTLALWGLVYSRLPDDASLVLATADIRYRAPVNGEIIALCAPPEEAFERFLRELDEQGRARLQASVEVPGSNGPAVIYTGTAHASSSLKTQS